MSTGENFIAHWIWMAGLAISAVLIVSLPFFVDGERLELSAVEDLDVYSSPEGSTIMARIRSGELAPIIACDYTKSDRILEIEIDGRVGFIIDGKYTIIRKSRSEHSISPVSFSC